MCFRVMAGILEFIIINVYCQYSVPIEKFLRRIEDLINCFPTEKGPNNIRCKCEISDVGR